MRTQRRSHSCILIQDDQRKKKVLVVGGTHKNNDHDSMGDLKSSEIYDPETEKWSYGIDLPASVQSSTLVTTSKTSKYIALLVGGYQSNAYSNRIYGLTKDMAMWEEVGYFTTPRKGHVAMQLPPQMVQECEANQDEK